VAVALTGCGVAPSPQQALSDSPGKTASAGSSRILVASDGEPYFSGTFEYDGGTGLVDQLDGESAMIVTEKAVFVETDFAVMGLEAGKARWLQYPPDDGALQVFSPFAATPADLFDMLAAAKEPTRAGSGEERGEPVTRYWATLDLAAFIAGLPPDDQTDLREFVAEIWPTALRDGVPMDLALDSKGRIRRVDLTFDEGEKFTVEFFDYGIDVRAAAPPLDEVITYAEYDKLIEKQMREECEKRGIKLPRGQVHCGSCGGEVPSTEGGAEPKPSSSTGDRKATTT
jgi:hypothetical protein